MKSNLSEAQIKALVERSEKLDALREKYQPHDKQKEVLAALKAGYRKIFIRAGRQSGKTQECCDVAWLIAGLNPNSICSIITPSLKQAKKIYWKKRTLQDFGPRDWVKKEQNDEHTIFFKNGSYIEIDGSDNIDDHRGDKKDLVILDEYKDIDPNFYSEVIEPMFLTTKGVVIIIGTPPETPESHFKELEMFAHKDPTWAVVHWTSYDSPYTDDEWLDAKRDELEARGELDVFKREYLAEYTKGGKNSVFQMLSRSLHVRSAPVVKRYYDQIQDRCELFWGSDPATSTIFGSLLIAYHREKGQIIFLNEIYEKDKQKTHTAAIVEEIQRKMTPFEPKMKRWQAFYDDAAAWFGNELLHGHKIAAFPAGKAAVEKEQGIALIKSLLLKKNTVIISEECECLLIEMENYVMVNGKYPKIGDHLIDVFRYFLIFAHVVLSLADNDDLSDDTEELLDYGLEAAFDETGLPEYMQ